MTEDEAKTKWCPQARYVIDGQTVFPTGNRFDGQGGTSRTAVEASEQCRCLGSDCMAWRWFGTHVNDPDGGPYLVFSNTTHGTCGLAGPWFAEMRRHPNDPAGEG